LRQRHELDGDRSSFTVELLSHQHDHRQIHITDATGWLGRCRNYRNGKGAVRMLNDCCRQVQRQCAAPALTNSACRDRDEWFALQHVLSLTATAYCIYMNDGYIGSLVHVLHAFSWNSCVRKADRGRKKETRGHLLRSCDVGLFFLASLF
jgi:hypothetical protein